MRRDNVEVRTNALATANRGIRRVFSSRWTRANAVYQKGMAVP